MHIWQVKLHKPCLASHVLLLLRDCGDFANSCCVAVAKTAPCATLLFAVSRQWLLPMCLSCSSVWLWLGKPHAYSASLCWLHLAVAVAATAAETREEDRGPFKGGFMEKYPPWLGGAVLSIREAVNCD